VRTLLDCVDRVNAAHPWSHNNHYIPWILRRPPSSAAGCSALHPRRGRRGRL